ncbi:MAG: hypothetical protein QM741_04185 [Rudaea sp.]|uniref:hypothetical protein n=1 Tax=Rudaea sp. TaxID=2136325 RepID=UPI0039E3456B
MSDDLLYRAGGPPGRLVPYRAGLDCWHALGADGVYRFEEEAPGESAALLARAAAEAANDAPLTSASLARQA